MGPLLNDQCLAEEGEGNRRGYLSIDTQSSEGKAGIRMGGIRIVSVGDAGISPQGIRMGGSSMGSVVAEGISIQRIRMGGSSMGSVVEEGISI